MPEQELTHLEAIVYPPACPAHAMELLSLRTLLQAVLGGLQLLHQGDEGHVRGVQELGQLLCDSGLGMVHAGCRAVALQLLQLRPCSAMLAGHTLWHLSS